MMCLGWFNQMDCNARPNDVVAQGSTTAADAAGVTDGTSGTSATGCGIPWWFYIVGAVIVGTGAVKK